MAEANDGFPDSVDDLGWPVVILILAISLPVLAVTVPTRAVRSLFRRKARS